MKEMLEGWLDMVLKNDVGGPPVYERVVHARA
jgi:hypothetical protein